MTSNKSTTPKNKSKLLLDSNPLIIIPELAVLIGLNESIILQQIHYWLQKSTHVFDGRVWVYNSIPQWCEQFPFLSKPTIERAIASLRNQKLILTGNYNQLKQDRTLWYTINYEALEALQEKSGNPPGSSSHQIDGMPPSQEDKSANPHECSSHHFDVMPPSKRCDDSINLTRPLPETTPEIPSETTPVSNETFIPKENNTHTDLKRGNITSLHSERAQEEEQEKNPKPVCEQVASTGETGSNDTGDFLEGKRTSPPLVEESLPREPVQHEQVQEEEQKAVCEKPFSLEQLQQDIKLVIGEEINVMRLARLVHTATLERIRYHLAHWHIHKQNQTHKGAGYFLTVVENDIPPQAPEKKTSATDKKPQRDNFEQREYTDEEFEGFYANMVT